MWLQQQGLPPQVAKNTSATYRSAARALAEQNPYSFIDTVPGFKLEYAENLAQAIGFSPSAPERAAAVLQQVLREAARNDSETAIPWGKLEQRAVGQMNRTQRPWPSGCSLRPGAEALAQEGKVVVEEAQLQLGQQQGSHQQQQQEGYMYEFKEVQSGWSNSALVMLQELHAAETSVVDFLIAAAEGCHKKLKSNASAMMPISNQLSQWIAKCEQQLSADLGVQVAFNDGQRQAIALAMSLPVVVLTGGPGCGKTLTSQAIARAWIEKGLQLAMAAPTGRA